MERDGTGHDGSDRCERAESTVEHVEGLGDMQQPGTYIETDLAPNMPLSPGIILVQQQWRTKMKNNSLSGLDLCDGSP